MGQSNKHIFNMMDQFLKTTGAKPGTVSPEEYEEFEIKRVLDTITPKFIHRLNMEDIMNISGDPSVTLCGVTVPLDRFMNKLTEVHDRYMKEKGYGDNGAAFERFGVIQATAEEVAEKYKKQYHDNCDCAVKRHAQFMLKAQDTALELYHGDVRDIRKKLKLLEITDPAMHIQVLEQLKLLDSPVTKTYTDKQLKDMGCELVIPADGFTPELHKKKRRDPLAIDKSAKRADNSADRGTSKTFDDKGFNPKKIEGDYR